MKRMFQGFAVIIIGVLGALVFLIGTIYVGIKVGILPVLCIFVLAGLMIAGYRIARSIIRNGHRIIHTWDTDAADEQGSTARAGLPQDPGGVYVQKRYSGVRRAERELMRRFTDDDPWEETANDNAEQSL